MEKIQGEGMLLVPRDVLQDALNKLEAYKAHTKGEYPGGPLLQSLLPELRALLSVHSTVAPTERPSVAESSVEKDICRHGWRGTVPVDGQRIVTPCPGCGAQSLFIASGGHLTCARVPSDQSDGCPSPCVGDTVEKLKQRAALYDALIYAVERKHEGETRHDTALRYIRQSEQHSGVGDADAAAQSQGTKEE